MENILTDKNLVFHGIGYNIFSFIGILKYGICSNSKSKELNNPFFCVNTLGSNGYDYICVSLSPSINGLETSDTFNKYVRNGIGFVIRLDENAQTKNTTGVMISYNDICYVKNHISTNNIVGIILNKDILNVSLSKLPLGINKRNLTYSTVVPKKCRHLLKCIEVECGYKIDSNLLNYYIGKKDYDKVEILMSSYMGEAFKYKLKKEDVTLNDIIDFYSQNRFSIYDENGIEINRQNVTKK